MATRVRNSDWQEDQDLKDDLVKYVRQNLRRKEILDFVKIDYPMYAWSPRTLSRRLQYLISASSSSIMASIVIYAKLLEKQWMVPVVY